MSRICIIVLLALVAVAAHAGPTNSLNLASYKLELGPIYIKGVSDNASGLAFNEDTKTLFVVINSPTRVIEVDLKGQVKRRIRLRGFSDTEGITWVGSNTFAVVEEGRGMFRLLDIAPGITSVSLRSAVSTIVDRRDLGNSGLEGLAYDSKKKRFFAVKERSPRRIYTWALPGEGRSSAVKELWNAEKRSLGLRDLSGIAYHAESGHLLVLSHESSSLVECTMDGQIVGRLSLRGMRQAEGVAISRAGNLYICSEPNFLYVYGKK